MKILDGIRNDLNILKVIYENTNGDVKFHIGNAINGLSNLVNDDIVFDNSIKMDIYTVHYIIRMIIDNLQYYNSKLNNSTLISAWFSLNMAINEMEFNNPLLEDYLNNKKVKVRA